MASINGIEIRSYRTLSGIEYPTIREANIWKNGKKIGNFREDEWGGENHLSNGLAEIVKPFALQYQKGCKDNWRKEYEGEADSLIEHILDLAEYEKTYKSKCKKGFPITLYICNDFKWIPIGCKISIKDNLPKEIKELIKREFPKGNYYLWEATGTEAFNITVDEKHPVPRHLERE